MIIPAAVVKVVGFKNSEGDNKISQQCLPDSTVLRAQIDTGATIDIRMCSTDSSFSTSLCDCLHAKTLGTIKKDAVSKAMKDLAFTDDERILSHVRNRAAQLKQEGLKDAAAKQKAYEEAAFDIIRKKRQIKAASILRFAIASDGKGNFTSKSLQVVSDANGVKKWGSGGIYYFAQNENVLPIEIVPSGQYLRVQTDKLISAAQIHFLISHAIRTANAGEERGQKLHMLRFIENQTMQPFFLNICRQINNLYARNKEGVNTRDICGLYCAMLSDLDVYLRNNPREYGNFKCILPIFYTMDDLTDSIMVIGEQGASPLQRLPESLVDLNFSKENPDVKNRLKEFLKNVLINLCNQQLFKIHGTYHFAAPNIFGESESWGFMTNNVAGHNFVLSAQDTRKWFDMAVGFLNEIKQSAPAHRPSF